MDQRDIQVRRNQILHQMALWFRQNIIMIERAQWHRLDVTDLQDLTDAMRDVCLSQGVDQRDLHEISMASDV